MRSLEKRQYEIEQGLRDPSELLGGKEKEGEGEDDDEEENEAAKAARAENLTKAAIAAANKLLKSTDEVERMKVSEILRFLAVAVAVAPTLLSFVVLGWDGMGCRLDNKTGRNGMSA